MASKPASTDAAKNMCVRALHMMADGTLDDFDAVVHPNARNREDVKEPPASRSRGPAAFYATALWLRDAYAELRWEIHQVVAEGELVVLHATMSGRHVRTLVNYDAGARPAQAFPPTGRRFATTQTHWFRIVDGRIIEHWANRDDLGTAMQLGWNPPSPRYLARLLLATRRVRREAARAREIAASGPNPEHRIAALPDGSVLRVR
jgi:predicted ester cyclase